MKCSADVFENVATLWSFKNGRFAQDGSLNFVFINF
jgi:hypothetical protein